MIVALALSPSLDVTYLLDRVRAGDIQRPREVIRLAGGKGLNLARAATNLGARVRVVAPLGGHLGALVAHQASLDGIELDVVELADETRSCVTVIPDDGSAPTEFYEPGTPLEEEDWARLVEVLSAAPAGGWTALSGGIPSSVRLDALGEALDARRRAGDDLAVDTHGPALHFLVHSRRPELVKVNRHEAAELLAGIVPADASAVQLAGGVHDVTGGLAVVTDGAAGSAAVDASGAWTADPDPEPGRYAVGSGDSFFAGLLVGLESGAPLRVALALAAAAGSANTRRPGAAVFDEADVAAARRRGHLREEAVVR